MSKAPSSSAQPTLAQGLADRANPVVPEVEMDDNVTITSPDKRPVVARNIQAELDRAARGTQSQGSGMDIDPKVANNMSVPELVAMMVKKDQQIDKLLELLSAERDSAQTSFHSRIYRKDASEIEKNLTRKALDFRDFDGSSKQTFKCWLGDFKSKISVLGDIDDQQFLRMLHSKISGAALDHVKNFPEICTPEGALVTSATLEGYLTVMRAGMFGEDASLLGVVEALLRVRQGGKPPRAFLHEKELLINKIPKDQAGDKLRAVFMLIGMDANLRAQIGPDRDSEDGMYESAGQVKRLALAAYVQQPEQQQKPQVTWSDKVKKPFFVAGGSGGSRHSSPGSDGGKRALGDLLDVKCSDCNNYGHKHKGFHGCPMHKKHKSTWAAGNTPKKAPGVSPAKKA
jgi:hypothetical protein